MTRLTTNRGLIRVSTLGVPSLKTSQSGVKLNAMNDLHKLFAEALAQSGLDVTALDETDLSEVLQSKIIPECAASVLDELKQRAPDMLREHREMEEGFQARNFERWAQGFDLLEMLIVIAEETGGAINDADRPTAVEENNAQFEAVVTLHARAVLVVREILCLLKNGFADGALGRSARFTKWP